MKAVVHGLSANLRNVAQRCRNVEREAERLRGERARLERDLAALRSTFKSYEARLEDLGAELVRVLPSAELAKLEPHFWRLFRGARRLAADPTSLAPAVRGFLADPPAATASPGARTGLPPLHGAGACAPRSLPLPSSSSSPSRFGGAEHGRGGDPC